MLSRDRLKQNYSRYENRCIIKGIEEEKILTFDEYIDKYYSHLEDEGGY